MWKLANKYESIAIMEFNYAWGEVVPASWSHICLLRHKNCILALAEMLSDMFLKTSTLSYMFQDIGIKSVPGTKMCCLMLAYLLGNLKPHN